MTVSAIVSMALTNQELRPVLQANFTAKMLETFLSDEYDRVINCPNTCFKDGKTLQKIDNNLIRPHLVSVDAREASGRMSLEDVIQKLKELKIVVVGEVVLMSCVMAFLLFRRRNRSGRRRRYR
ncbi:uncharacterized protein LOC122093185 isoform X2 [Macadamia integrifolia]|uniref:uncharacterized protein LOC122093185 isoform X2 n=1 Tax=Macadamia integrifolia TaxID=60698 RepID=UPI001C528908|nr:uncharacterized protein LOC122093185 isoform X2 [Macadamia integrifolia]